jgi:hypothetical protein
MQLMDGQSTQVHSDTLTGINGMMEWWNIGLLEKI